VVPGAPGESDAGSLEASGAGSILLEKGVAGA
jgi:hypothetical protein